ILAHEGDAAELKDELMEDLRGRFLSSPDVRGEEQGRSCTSRTRARAPKKIPRRWSSPSRVRPPILTCSR
ncbi:hypothetical protein, partial [Streptomyces sp. NPDC006415]|uniref:hypothetical protein n=1 Tax=Streptomyces sp. NPDC006415 TaxID=3155351 RepID=UPI0033A09852